MGCRWIDSVVYGLLFAKGPARNQSPGQVSVCFGIALSTINLPTHCIFQTEND
jgi:hypothetical protein